MINFTRVITATRRPELKLLFAGLAVAWGIGMLTHAAQSRQDEVDELDKFAAEKREHLAELDQLLAEHEERYGRLRRVNDQLTAEHYRLQRQSAETAAAADAPSAAQIERELAAVAAMPDIEPPGEPA